MRHWKRSIEAANRCFHQGQLQQAQAHYQQALAWSEMLFGRWQEVDEAVSALVISHHNLADLHLQLDEPEASADYLCAAHQRLLQAAQDPRLSQALRDAALRHSGKTYAELLSFISSYGEYPRVCQMLYGSVEPVDADRYTHHVNYGVH